MPLPYAREKDATYENFIALCPHCGVKNVYNRASDLQTFEPIDFRTVTCLSTTCGRSFNVNGDSINPAHQMLLFDCYGFIQDKQYMQCVLSVAQACEVFFSHFLHVQLLYRAFAADNGHDVPRLNRLAEQLYDKIYRLTFEPMRRLFLKLVIEDVAPKSLDEAETVITNLPERPQEITKEAIEKVADDRLRELLLQLYSSSVNKLRNRVVHKHAYRPTATEATEAREEAGEILHRLTARLQLEGDANWYINQAGR